MKIETLEVKYDKVFINGKDVTDAISKEFLQIEKPKYWVVKTDTSHPLWEKFREWFKEESGLNASLLNFNAYDGYARNKGYNNWNTIDCFENNPTLITLEEWNEGFNDQKEEEFVLPESWWIRVNTKEEAIVYEEFFEKNNGGRT